MKNMAETCESVVDKVEWVRRGSVLGVGGIERVCDVFEVRDGGEDET